MEEPKRIAKENLGKALSKARDAYSKYYPLVKSLEDSTYTKEDVQNMVELYKTGLEAQVLLDNYISCFKPGESAGQEGELVKSVVDGTKTLILALIDDVMTSLDDIIGGN